MGEGVERGEEAGRGTAGGAEARRGRAGWHVGLAGGVRVELLLGASAATAGRCVGVGTGHGSTLAQSDAPPARSLSRGHKADTWAGAVCVLGSTPLYHGPWTNPWCARPLVAAM